MGVSGSFVTNWPAATDTGAATDSNLTAIGGAAGASPPALASGASGLVGWLRKINDTLAGSGGGPASTVNISQTIPGTTNGVVVNNSSLAVTGTFWQATQPVSGTFWQTTQPISVASLPLPSGAATAAKQPVLGTAGSASADVLTVQGVGSMTALKVDGSGVTQPVSGTFWQATQPVSGTFWQATQPVSGTFWQATQPISGTVTANAGTNLNTSALALDATLTGGTQQSKITDGTNVATVKAASTAAVAADKAIVVTQSPNNTVGVTGTFWQATQPVSGTFWQTTQPISAASLPLPTGASLDATLTGGTQRNRITDGTNNAAVKAASTQAAAADPAVVVAQSPNTYASSRFRLLSAAATTNLTNVKNAAGRLFKLRGYCAKAAVCYLKIYDKATAPVVATDTPIFTFALKASDVFDIDLGALGYPFANGIGFGMTGANADTDATALVAADIVGFNMLYT
jgi:hypothetical protein